MDSFWIVAIALALYIVLHVVLHGAWYLWDRMLSIGKKDTVAEKTKILKRKQRINTGIILLVGAAATAASFHWVRSVDIAVCVVSLTGIIIFMVLHTTKNSIAQLHKK